MRIYKRGSLYWTEFEVDKKRYQMSTRTKDKKLAGEVTAALQADTIRNKFILVFFVKPLKKGVGIRSDRLIFRFYKFFLNIFFNLIFEISLYFRFSNFIFRLKHVFYSTLFYSA